MEKHPVTAVIVGGGHRSFIYADYSLTHPEDLKIVGIADPNRERCIIASRKYGFSEEFCIESAEELAKQPKLADAVINGTMDHQHFMTAAPLLEKGYDMLLEKPFACSADEMHRLLSIVRAHGNKVMVCHVLRYADFYLEIKKRILNGDIGDIMNIQTVENVSYHHLSTSYVRGKWANSDICKTSMLLAKSCHDIDIMTWMMLPVKPERVSSFGGKFQFRPENAPKGAGTRCLSDCPYVDTCRYSAKDMYLGHPERWAFYAWTEFEGRDNVTYEEKAESLRTTNPYGRCIYKCDNNVVDHQSVLVEFENGATGTHNMIGGTASSGRSIHITGTKGEIFGDFESGRFTVSLIANGHPDGCEKIEVDTSTGEGHGGGDEALIADFTDFVRTGEQSVSCTSIYNSVEGHLTVFLADKSREEGGAPQVCDYSLY